MICEDFNAWVNEQGGLSAATENLKSALNDPKLVYQNLQYWVRNGVPVNRVLGIEAATGISRSALRPDIYPDAAA